MERMIKALDKVKRSPVTLDSCFRKMFEMSAADLREYRSSFEGMMMARVAIHLRDMQGCVNMEIEDPAFEDLKSVIKSCVEKTKHKKKRSLNANTSGQGG